MPYDNVATCGQCKRHLHLTAEGVFPQHTYSDTYAGQLCTGGGKRPDETFPKVKKAPGRPRKVAKEVAAPEQDVFDMPARVVVPKVEEVLHELVIRNLSRTQQEYATLAERLAGLNDKAGATVYAEVSLAIGDILKKHTTK